MNVIAPLLTRGDELLVQSIFYPFAMYTKRREGIALSTTVEGPSYANEKYGEVTFIDSSAILDGDTLHVFSTNRSLNEPAPLMIDLADGEIAALINAEILSC